MRNFDLDAYLGRIGYQGSRRPTLDTLEALHRLHPAAIPFENLNPLLGLPVALDLESLQAKMIAGRRGGWCFEQNTLFRAALEALQFSVASLGARVLWNAPAGAPVGPRSHMLLVVDIGGQSYIADVGFGGNVLTAPLRLEPNTAQSTPHEPHRLVPLENGFVLEACVRGEWIALYRFTIEPQFHSDFEVSNWYLCHHPSSFFRYQILAALAKREARYALRNNALSIHRPGETEKRTLNSAAALRACLESDFGIELPELPELANKFDAISQTLPEPAK